MFPASVVKNKYIKRQNPGSGALQRQSRTGHSKWRTDARMHLALAVRHIHGCDETGLHVMLNSVRDNTKFCQKIYKFCPTSWIQAMFLVMHAFHTYTFMYKVVQVLLVHSLLLMLLWHLGQVRDIQQITPNHSMIHPNILVIKPSKWMKDSMNICLLQKFHTFFCAISSMR